MSSRIKRASFIDESMIRQRSPDMVHADMAAVVGCKVRIDLPVDSFETFCNLVSIFSNDDAVAAYISHIGEIPHQHRRLAIESSLQEPIRFRYAIQPAKTFFSQFHGEKIDPLVASRSGTLVVHSSFPNLPDGIDADGLSRFRNEGIGGKRPRANRLCAANPKFGAAFTLACKGHRQDKADIVGEFRGLVDKGQSEPSALSKGRVADDGIMRSIQGGLPSAIVPANEVGAPGDKLDTDAPTLGKQIVESAFSGARVDHRVAGDICMILAHCVQEVRVASPCDLGAGEKAVQPRFLGTYPRRNHRVRAPRGIAMIHRSLDRIFFTGPTIDR